MCNEIEYSLRFIGFTKEDSNHLIDVFKDYNATIRERRNDKKLIFTCELVPSNFELIVNTARDVKATKKDVFVSALPESDSGLFDIPDYVLQVIKIEGVELTLSFTFIDD